MRALVRRVGTAARTTRSSLTKATNPAVSEYTRRFLRRVARTAATSSQASTERNEEGERNANPQKAVDQFAIRRCEHAVVKDGRRCDEKISFGKFDRWLVGGGEPPQLRRDVPAASSWTIQAKHLDAVEEFSNATAFARAHAGFSLGLRDRSFSRPWRISYNVTTEIDNPVAVRRS